jgi:hypothetical protein
MNSLTNNNNFNLSINSGDGGDGGAMYIGHSDYNNGSGGFAGFIFFNINKINNTQEFNLSVNSGDGGNSGITSVGTSIPRQTADGGFGGSIIPNINDINNTGNLNINLNSGNGGSGINVGNGGYVFDMLFSNVINKITSSSDDFLINILSGEKGLPAFNSLEDGKPGSTGDIIINNLLNASPNFEIVTKVNDNSILEDGSQCCADVVNKIEPTSGDIVIENLENNSYLPKTLKTQNNNLINLSEIIINSCYIKDYDITNLDYDSRTFYLSSVNGEDILSNFNNYYSGISIFGKNINECPYCESIAYDSSFRIYEDYSLYSNINGHINVGDLNIYYAKDSNALEILRKGTDNFLLYTNKNIIYSQESDFDLLYKYELNKNLLYNVSENRDFVSDDKLYCPAQHYYIKGKISYNNQSKLMEFPFTPLFSLE